MFFDFLAIIRSAIIYLYILSSCILLFILIIKITFLDITIVVADIMSANFLINHS